jgi:hypothetical protein
MSKIASVGSRGKKKTCNWVSKCRRVTKYQFSGSVVRTKLTFAAAFPAAAVQAVVPGRG